MGVTAACGSVQPQRELIPGRAVVIHAADRAEAARLTAERLEAAGFDVAVEVEGPPVRPRSSIAVYRIARPEPVLDAAHAALDDLGDVLGDVEWLPFVHAGPPGTDVVVWLVSRERDEAARRDDAESPDRD